MAQALTIPKHRLDGLTDAVFGVAMTLLVLDLKLPETASFKSASEFLHALSELDTQFPQYGFASHKGYGTAVHLAALQAHGACPQHRRSFAPVRQAGDALEPLA